MTPIDAALLAGEILKARQEAYDVARRQLVEAQVEFDRCNREALAATRALTLTDGRTVEASFDSLLTLVCSAFEVQEADVRSSTHRREIVDARTALVHVLRRFTSLSFPAIGDRFGRDHSTIWHLEKRAGLRLAESPDFARRLAGLERAVEEGLPAAPTTTVPAGLEVPPPRSARRASRTRARRPASTTPAEAAAAAKEAA
jgi:hypothetical protein